MNTKSRSSLTFFQIPSLFLKCYTGVIFGRISRLNRQLICDGTFLQNPYHKFVDTLFRLSICPHVATYSK